MNNNKFINSTNLVDTYYKKYLKEVILAYTKPK